MVYSVRSYPIENNNMKPAEKYWNRTFDSLSQKEENPFDQIVAHTLKYLRSSDSILDIGCAAENLPFKFSNQVASRLAIDICEDMIDLAHSKKRSIKNIQFTKATLNDLTSTSLTFDIILAFNPPHLLPETKRDFQRVNALLKKEGLYICATPIQTERVSQKNVLFSLLGSIGRVPNLELSTPSSIIQLVNDDGFETIETKKLSGPRPYHFMVAQKK